jgi:hypothetical protein
MQARKTLFSFLVLFAFTVAYAAVPQQPQTRPAPGGGQSGGGRPPGGGNPGGGRPPGGGSPGGGGSTRPPGGGNSGGGKPPGGGGNTRPPGGGNPGGGNNNRPPPRPNPGNRPSPGRPTSGRPPQWGRPPQNRPSYSFRRNDWGYLHNYYRRNLGYVNLATRPRFVIGGFFPYTYIPYITALPPNVYGYLPPPPPGYSMGYYDGYVVVYDPLTYFIANVIDLMQQQ